MQYPIAQNDKFWECTYELRETLVDHINKNQLNGKKGLDEVNYILTSVVFSIIQSFLKSSQNEENLTTNQSILTKYNEDQYKYFLSLIQKTKEIATTELDLTYIIEDD